MVTRSETEFFNGWDMGRNLCLSKGPDTARQWLREHPRDPQPYREGMGQAIRDYLDADGLPERDPLETA